MSQSRQLVAIMFTDIVGYTALMGDDEQRAFEILNKSRQLQKPEIENYGGKWIKELGDGVLASFSTVTDAVGCACSIIKACEQVSDLKLRIGIHQGEVIFENEDVFGDGVNIASRLQALAPVGGIYISESVYKNVVNKKQINTKYVRQEVLKNVKEAVQIYEVITRTSDSPSELIRKESKKISTKSVAVLPFVNMSNDPDQEYFSDGMAEEIINSLNQLKDLKIAGRTSSFQFKGKNIDLREIGEKLGVTTVLEGSVRKQGNRLRITAQLINVEDGFHLWSEKYDRNLDDIFAIQDEIALAITEQLKVTLLQKDHELITKSYTQSAEAYELYLKGRFYLSRRGASIITGLEFFKQAISVDPNYALAYSGYAFANILYAAYNYLPGIRIIKEIKQAAESAIRLDPLLGEAYSVLGYYYSCVEINWIESKKCFLKAIELDPKYVQARSIYSLHYLAWGEGKFNEAEQQGLTAIKLEPLSAIDHADLAWVLHTAGRFEESLVYAKAGVELDGNSFLSHRICALCYLSLKSYQKAIDSLAHLLTISNRHQHALNPLIWAYCSVENFEEARKLLNELKDRSATEYIAGTYLGISYAYLADLDTAFDCLENASSDHDPMLTQIKFSPIVPPALKNDVRFQNLMSKLAFPGSQ
jgi:TolB-like protein/class 3 adenylate cyclase/Tfp pilus assembly protein PilF